MEQQACIKLLQTDLTEYLTRIYRITTFASSPVTTTAVENAESDHNVDDYGCDVRAIGSTAPDGTDNESHCGICLEPYEEAHTEDVHPEEVQTEEVHIAFEIAACSHRVGKSCLSHWLNCTTPNANTCPYCRQTLFSRPEPQPPERNTLLEVMQLWIQVEQTITELMEFCEQWQDRLDCQAAIHGFLQDVLSEVNYDFFLNDVGYCLEYLEEPKPWVLVRSVDWHG